MTVEVSQVLMLSKQASLHTGKTCTLMIGTMEHGLFVGKGQGQKSFSSILLLSIIAVHDLQNLHIKYKHCNSYFLRKMISNARVGAREMR